MTTTVQTDEDDDVVNTYDEITRQIWRICSPILMVLGTVGNILTILVSLRRAFRNSSTMLYLTVLAVTDTLVLYIGLLYFWLLNAYNYNLRTLSDGMCKFHYFIVYVLLDYAAWILVAVSVERFISVKFPFRVKRYCTRHHAWIVLVIIFVCLLLINQHFLWMVGVIDRGPDDSECDVNDPLYLRFVRKTFPWIDFCTFFFLPFTIIVICNVTIIRHMAMSRHRVASHRRPIRTPGRSRSNPLTDSHRQLYTQETNISIIHLQIPRQLSTSCNNLRREIRERSCGLTLMLLTVTFVFLITTSPIVVYLIGLQYWSYWNDSAIAIDVSPFFQLIWTIVRIIQYINNSINIFLYCLTGRFFREQLFAVLGRKARVIPIDTEMTINTGRTNN